MNIDDLSKSQLLLLTLLVNFVMSIATGIVTVSLLDEAPANVTQTINRIVEHTVETVTPASQSAAVVTTTTASAPSEEDQLVSAVSGAAARTVSLYADATTSPALARGIYLPRSRAVVVPTVADKLPQNALIEFPNGSTAQVSISHADTTLTIYGFSDDATLPNVTVAPLLDSANVKQGQAVIALTDDGSAVTGIVSKVDGDTITTTLPAVPAGTAAMSLKGEIVGIATAAGSAFVSASHVSTLLSAPTTP